MGLIVAELAVTLTLLSGVGSMLRSLLVLYRESQVIDPSGLVTMPVTVGGSKYSAVENRRAFFTRVQEALAAAGEIESSTMVGFNLLPLRGGLYRSLVIDGRPKPAGAPPGVTYIMVGARYFETLGLRLLRGRPFTPLDGTPGHQSAVVNQRFVDMFFPDEDPIGRRIHLSNPGVGVAPPPPLTIVGVLPTVRQRSDVIKQPDPVVYAPLQVDAGMWAGLILRPRTDLETVVSAVRREVSKLEAEAPVSDVMPLEDAITESPMAGAFLRRLTQTHGIFAGVALVLAAVGIYAVTAYTVAQRTQEIGLRVALGARTSQVVGLFVRQAMQPLALGVLFGLGGAFAAGRLLWRSTPAPTRLLIVALFLVATSLAAAVYPSWRGARVDPSTALRGE